MKSTVTLPLSFPLVMASLPPTKITSERAAEDVIKALSLVPHPEKGFFTETFRDTSLSPTGRPQSTQIYYLLKGGEGVSHWHRVLDAVEVWHFYDGAPLRLSLSWNDGGRKPGEKGEGGDEGYPAVRDVILGKDLWNGERPQVIVQKGEWQHARSLGDWTLVGCTVAPGFVDSVFEMAEPGWEPLGAMEGK